jgi:hypothetical protein
MWIDESALDMYGRGDAAPAVTVTSRDGMPEPGSWLGALLRFAVYPGLAAPAAYEIISRAHGPGNLGRPYYVARFPD